MDYWKKLRQCFGVERFIVTAAAGAIVEGEKILLVKNRSLGKWQIPGGLQEVGESLQQTIQREIKEELGLDLMVDRLIGVYSGTDWNIDYPDGGKLQQVLHFFLMKGDPGILQIQKREIEDAKFFPIGEPPEDIMPCCKQKIADLRAFSGKVFIR